MGTKKSRVWRVAGTKSVYGTKDAAIASVFEGKHGRARAVVNTQTGVRFDLLGKSYYELSSTQWISLVGKFADLGLYASESGAAPEVRAAYTSITNIMGPAFRHAVRNELITRASASAIREKISGRVAGKRMEPPPVKKTDEELSEEKLMNLAAEKLADKLLGGMLTR